MLYYDVKYYQEKAHINFRKHFTKHLLKRNSFKFNVNIHWAKRSHLDLKRMPQTSYFLSVKYQGNPVH